MTTQAKLLSAEDVEQETKVTTKDAHSLHWPDGSSCTVGQFGVTRITRVPRNGMYCAIPYFEVWKGDVLQSEHCQHYIESVVWEPA